jgi:acetoin utilization protein AcuC
MIRDFLDSAGLLASGNVTEIQAESLPVNILERVHSSQYIEKVRTISETGQGEIDIDTPGFKGIYENALVLSGATVTGVRAILSGRVQHFLSPTGGFHHAKFEKGGGFCVFNDIAAAVSELKQTGLNRILIADFDVHHGNGDQAYFYDDPEVMVIDFHEDPEWMYPHEGYVNEVGSGRGLGYKINMPFPMDAGDEVYRYAFDELVPKLIDFFRPQFILFLPGLDAQYLDRLAHLKLTTTTIRYITERIHKAAHKWSDGRLGVVTGGGYHPDSLCWGVATVMSMLSGHKYTPPKQKPPFKDDAEMWKAVRETVGQVKEQVFPVLGI